jgi:hypothetical protein
MDDPSTLRRKAAEFFENAASSTATHEAEKLNEVGCQLELWADDLEEMLRQSRSIPALDGPGTTRSGT